ncbi:hypothetical protein SDC9_173185 [bioreactor metagenome]|uniref:Uncharacterized protein n=1 Tax=bioreactor metagenome TaxID=1076179 RepID=A0A645GHX7_9ZZZZ
MRHHRGDGGGGLRRVGGDQHLHVGQRAHDGQILQVLVGGPVLPNAEPCVGGDDLDVQVGVAD